MENLINIKPLPDAAVGLHRGENKEMLYCGYTQEQLQTVFSAIQNPQDWKAPIAVAVRGEILDAVIRAIEFFTATVPTVNLNLATMKWHVSGEGYRNGPAGDH